jgi:cytochrome b561/polyisoprenoid-binding protein YceI
MQTSNTATSYGVIARTLHWLTALIILANIPLGVVANGMPFATGDELASKAQLFSIHKTLGLAAFGVALIRILWALTQTRPEPVHPDRTLETRLAELVHWSLYISLVAVPLSGWVHHAATDGFAPILWPLGQDLPLVPTSESVASTAAAMHWLFTKILAASILLHIAGALKHAVIDRDGTLSRMARGTPVPQRARGAAHPRTPAIAAFVIFAAGAGLAWSMAAPPSAPVAQTATPPATATAGNWQVTQGTLGFSIKQMGADLSGSFATWSADIRFDDTTGTGTVTVTIDTTSLAIGSVTDQAKGTEFFDTTTHPTAIFTADITPSGTAYLATGTLTLRGATVPVSLPFQLTLTGDTAEMTGTVDLNRQDFGIGPSYKDETTVGFTAAVTVALTATRK